jgi:hypothetical protein
MLRTKKARLFVWILEAMTFEIWMAYAITLFARKRSEGLSDGRGDFFEIRGKELLGGNSALHDRPCSSCLDEMNVCDPHETEDEAEIGGLVVQSG